MSTVAPYKILLLEAIHPGAKYALEHAGFKVECEDQALQGDELVARAQGFHALGIRSKTQVTAEVLSKISSLKAVGAYCIGTNQVDLEHANALGLPVFNAPYSNTRSVAELVICEVIALSRQVFERSQKAHMGEWVKTATGSNEVRGKTLGIVGYGHIGSQLSVLAEALGLNVIYFDIVKKLPLGNANSVESLDDLLSQSDFVSLHVPETEQTKLMIAKDQLAKMKKGSYLVNASRGTVVSILDLKKSIESGHIAGAALDVFPEEPGSNKEKFFSELQRLPNVILTPHIGGSTEEAQKAIGEEVSESFSRFFLQGSTSGAVNFPALDVPPMSGLPRIVNTHKNVPGVLGKINSIISEQGGNIKIQYLSTDPLIGYVVFEVSGCDPHKVVAGIEKLNVCLSTRLIHPVPGPF